jgi:hypothetical protein
MHNAYLWIDSELVAKDRTWALRCSMEKILYCVADVVRIRNR